MILIRHIDFYEVDLDTVYIPLHHGFADIPVLDEAGRKVPAPISEVQELVHGRRFTRPDGSSITVGLSVQAQDVLGLQFDAWTNLQRDYNACHINLTKANKVIAAASAAPLWTRIKWLFLGFS